MPTFLRRFFPSGSPAPTPRPRFRPALEVLGERITPTVSFATQVTQATGTTPQSVATGDFNNDGRPDEVVVNAGANTVSVLLNATGSNSAPSFLAQQTFAVGNNPLVVAVADLNGDGRADLVVSNYNANTVSVLLNTTTLGSATASFAAQQTLAVDAGPQGVVVRDLNGDGRADIATANFTANTVSVLLNATAVGATAVTFSAQQSFTVAAGAAAIVAGDFNGDGRADLATANYSNNSLSVLRNTTAQLAATVAFATPVTVTVGTFPLGLVAADFNGDGLADLATANSGGSNTTVSVLRNTSTAGGGTISFAAQQTFSVGVNPFSVAAADLNGDGRADLIATNRNDNTVSVLENSTAALATSFTFANQQTFATGVAPNALAAADFNADGRVDLIAVNASDNTVSVLRNNAAANTFSTTGPVLAGQFGTTGLAALNRASNTWTSLTGSNASALATAPNGNLVATFPTFGIYYYRPIGTFIQIDSQVPNALAIDPLGNVYANFSNGTKVGTFVYRLSTGTWSRVGLTSAQADQLAVSANGDVFANFLTYGVYRYRSTDSDFTQINGNVATSLTADANGYVVANFANYGVAQYIPYALGWRSLAPATTANSIAVDSYGNVFASFANLGVSRWSYLTGSWTSLTPNATTTALGSDAYGNLAAAFSGFGVWEYSTFYGWTQRRTSDASRLNLV